MKLILAEKPSTARILAHVVGAREKIYSKIEKAFCYFGNSYYVLNARGHLYGLGEPEDYGYSKKYNIEELPMFPDFKIFPCGEIRKICEILSQRLSSVTSMKQIIVPIKIKQNHTARRKRIKQITSAMVKCVPKRFLPI